MRRPASWSEDNLLAMAAIIGKSSVKTQYACQVVKVSADGRFVDVMHNTLEWEACVDGDKVMINEFGKDVLCSPTKPWVIADVPVEESYERGQWKVRVRPKVGDRGILSVFYHDIRSLKEKGGFQAPDAIRIMSIDSASFRPGLPNHADVNAEQETYPTDDQWELKGNGVSVKLTSPADSESNSPDKMEINVGNVSFTVTVPKQGDPTIVLNAPNGALTVNSKSATVNADTTTVNSTNSTIKADTAVTIDTPTTTVTGSLNVGGAVTMASTLDVTGATTLASTLNVTGPVIASSTLTVAGVVTAGGLALGTSGFTTQGDITAANITATNDITGKNVKGTTEVTVGNIPLSTHKHTGIEPGSGTSGGPTA